MTVTAPIVGVMVVAVLVTVARLRRRAEVQAGQVRERQAALAPTIDLLAMTIGAGGTVADGVVVVAERGPPAVREAFDLVADRRRNVVLVDALPLLVDVLGADYHPLAMALIAGEQGGAPVGSLLQRLAEEAEQARRRSSELALAALPVKLLIPLVVCQLPAVVIGAVVPLTLVALRHLRG